MYLLIEFDKKKRKNHTSLLNFNQFYGQLEAHSKFGIKTFLEAPDPDVLLNSQARYSRPCKLFNASHGPAQLFGEWSDQVLMDHVNTSFMFADMSEAIERRAIAKRTSLRRILALRDELVFETSVKFRMPAFFK